ncbi:DUF2971 domain-containing protein [Vibrio parahaemolyticus]|nr:DUF2971 domain-containing protein [Vibrio parahaemolyticus]
MKLYKYVPFSDGSKNILSNCTMKFSSAEEFNDPFDCVVSYDVEKSLEYALSRTDLLENAKMVFQGNVADEGKMIENLKSSLVSGDFTKSMTSSFGICSLSETFENILMWSHYADNHKGFVVEFETPTNFAEFLETPEYLLIAWAVQYKSDMPKVTMGKADGFEALAEQFLVKAKDWEYEQEHRCLAHIAGPGIHSFYPKLITGVIAGAKMSDADLNELQLLVKSFERKHDVSLSFKRAAKAKEQYRLEFV